MESDYTECPPGEAFLTSDLSTDYLRLIPDMHHMFIGLTQVEGTRIVMMATSKAPPTDPAAAQRHSDTTGPVTPDNSQPTTRTGNNDGATNTKERMNKDEDGDKKRKATESVDAAPPQAKRNPVNEPGPSSGPPAPKTQTCPPARDVIEEWLDDETAAGRGFIRTERKIYRPPLPSKYTEQELDDDLLEGHDWLYEEHGKAILQTVGPLPPRDNIIQFTDKPEYIEELEKNLVLDQCPPELHAAVRDLCIEFWDCFTQDGLSLPIRGFEFVVDTGAAKPIACKIPRYKS